MSTKTHNHLMPAHPSNPRLPTRPPAKRDWNSIFIQWARVFGPLLTAIAALITALSALLTVVRHLG